MKRVRHTPPQASLSRKERLDNVRGAFAVKTKGKAAVKGKTVVLVDDVMTTGATIHACCKALKRAGAKEVRVLTLARRLRED
jgi:predicted amidophosphoribosyltransferase